MIRSPPSSVGEIVLGSYCSVTVSGVVNDAPDGPKSYDAFGTISAAAGGASDRPTLSVMPAGTAPLGTWRETLPPRTEPPLPGVTDAEEMTTVIESLIPSEL